MTGLDSRQIEQIVDQVEQVPPLAGSSAQLPVFFGGQRNPPSRHQHVPVKPMMAFEGVLSSWLMLARNSVLGEIGPLGLILGPPEFLDPFLLSDVLGDLYVAPHPALVVPQGSDDDMKS